MAGQIIKRAENTWTVRIYVGRSGDGKRKYQNQTIHGIKKDAQTWLNDALRKQDIGIPTFQTKTTLGDFLDKWLTTVAQPRVGERTFRDYEWQLGHVKTALGTVRLSQLRAEDIQKLYSGLTASTARHFHSPLRSALSQAVRWHLIHANPCDAVDLPRCKAAEVQALTREEAGRLLAVERFTRKNKTGSVVVENRHRVLFAFLLTTGARPSEALGLKWTDIDFEKGLVTIQRTLQWHSKKMGGGWYFEDTKTKCSKRSVPLPASMVQQLREHRAAQAEALLKIGIRTDLCFANSEGGPILRRNLVRRHFKPALKAAKLSTAFSLYALRHTCATLLLQAGVHPKVVSERLGHSSTTLTMDVYSHVLPGMQADATAQIERMLYG
ncbi:MAG TPA: tyrosine-type recombinase/integrase [Pyrinomonadaceae bacterium]|nr:tyrosine-type recombinase/integrase [Pyrinomonadaceae bacterium]